MSFNIGHFNSHCPMNKQQYLSRVQRRIQMQTGHQSRPAQDSVIEKAFDAFCKPTKRWLWICGNIGAGKTTVAKAIAQSISPYHFIKAIDIMNIETLLSLSEHQILIIDDAGKNPEKINNMGVYIDVIPYILHKREDKGITIFTSQHKFESLIITDFSLIDRFKSIGSELILTDKSLRYDS